MRGATIGITILAVCGLPLAASSDTSREWYERGRSSLAELLGQEPIHTPARNVILFIGDGMGVSTITAARILEGQQRGEPGEENFLSFELFPYTALIKTYETNAQVPDSAGTMTAIVTGAKTKKGLLSVGPELTRQATHGIERRALPTLLELAEDAGLSTGLVTSTRLTHATPAACYAHTTDRDWESDRDLPASAREAGISDIARQLIELPHGNGVDVALGGGRSLFLPVETKDPETGKPGKRGDGRDLTREWTRRPGAAFVWNREQLAAVDPAQVGPLLGLFAPSHLGFAAAPTTDPGADPSLSEMTAVAIEILKRNPKGYFLMVEGGRIDHAHHGNNAFNALSETLELARAVALARQKTDGHETLILVTADHSHGFNIAGYAVRGNPILGKVREGDPRGEYAVDLQGKPYTTLSYANGQPARKGEVTDTEAASYRQNVLTPLPVGTHAGEDVPLYATGPRAHLFRGVLEQNLVFHILAHALELPRTLGERTQP